jgi:hypothetical protein
VGPRPDSFAICTSIQFGDAAVFVHVAQQHGRAGDLAKVIGIAQIASATIR